MALLLEYEITVKFRAFGITFGTAHYNGAKVLGGCPAGVGVSGNWITLVNDRGLFARVRLSTRPTET